ncbi:extensin [Streptomyces sp. NPDC057680]|uniref:extensin n=1 Tax=Streptomyces sp. NPDC057680 TaxID=3346208 RepID=UPI0036983CC4
MPTAVPLFTPTTAATSPAPVPAVQRSAAAPPHSGALAPQGSARPVVPLARPSAARPVARPVVQRQAAAGAPPSVTPAAAPAVPVVTPAPLQRTSAAPGPVPAAHAPRAAAAVSRTAPTAPSPSVQRTAAAPGSAEPESPTQLDELARRLVTPLSRLLRAELRADRERVGRLRDHGR